MKTEECYVRVWLGMVTLFIMMNCHMCEALKHFNDEKEVECENDLKKVLLKPLFDNVGSTVMEKYETNGTGFVYSHLKILHKLIQLYKLLSNWSKYVVSQYLGLDKDRYDPLDFCRGFHNIIEEMNGRIPQNILFYTSWMISGNLSDSMDACCTKVDFSFRNIIPAVATAKVNQLYRSYCNSSSYLQHELDIRSMFYLASAFRVTPAIFGDSKIIEDDYPFTDLDGTQHTMNWVKMIGNFWLGGKNRAYGDKTSSCNRVQLIHSEVGNGTLYMLYFQPLFRDESTSEKTKCFEEIFSNLKDYINKTINKESSNTFITSTTDKLGVPLIELSSDINLKHILPTDIHTIFYEDQIFGVEGSRQTLYELRTWEYLGNRPSESEIPQGYPLTVDYIRSPFAFALVDKQTHILLKAGAYLRPKTN